MVPRNLSAINAAQLVVVLHELPLCTHNHISATLHFGCTAVVQLADDQGVIDNI